MRRSSGDRHVHQSNPLLDSVRGWPLGQHPRNLRCSAFLQDANSHQHVHRESGHCRRVLPHRHTLPRDNHEQGLMDIRYNNVQGFHDSNQHQSIHQQYIPLHNERRSVHSSLSSDQLAETSNDLHLPAGLLHRLGIERPLHDSGVSLRKHDDQPSRCAELQYLLAQRPRRSDHLYALHLRSGFCHSPCFHLELLLPRHQEAANSWPEEQVQGQEALASQGHQAGVDGDHRLRDMLAALLAHPDSADLHTAQSVSNGHYHHHIPAGAVPELLQQRDESNTLRLLERQLQEELLEGVHVHSRQGRECHVAHREQRVPAQEQEQRRQNAVQQTRDLGKLANGARRRGRREPRTVHQQDINDNGDNDLEVEHHRYQRAHQGAEPRRQGVREERRAVHTADTSLKKKNERKIHSVFV